MLARIHAVPCSPAKQDFLLDADAEVTWSLQSETVPAWRSAHPDGPTVWHTVRDQWHRPRSTAPGLVHLDYWPGNVLWRGQEIAAVVDWEEAARGHPAIDVAYCRMDLCLSGTPAAAEAFLLAYEERAGTVPDLPLFELAAAARPMYSPAGWISEPPTHANLRLFIASALERLTTSTGA